MIKRFLTVLVPAAVLMLLPFSARGQADNASVFSYSGMYTLDEIIVSARQPAVESVTTVRSISAEEIEQKGARTLDEALEMVPGLNVRTGGKGVPRINLRGFRPRHVLLLLDGIPVNSTYDGQFDPTVIPVENIKSIKVTTGGSSVLYGQGGLGGSINIITRRGDAGVHGMVTQEFGEHVSYNSRFSLAGAEKALDFFLSGSMYKTDGFELSRDFNETVEENGGLRENTDRRRKNVFAKLGYSPSERWLLGLTFSAYEGEFGNPPNTINNKQDPFAKKVKYERTDDQDSYSFQLSANYDAPGPLELKSWVYVNRFDEERNRYDDDDYNSMDDVYIKQTYHQKTETGITGGNIHARYDADRLGLVTLAFGAEHDSWDAEGSIRDRFVAVGGVTPEDLAGGGGGGGGGGSSDGSFKKNKYYYMRDFDQDFDLDIYSAAVEYEVKLSESVGIVLGYSHHWLSKDYGDNDDDWSFLTGIHYDLFPGTRLRAAVSRKVRFPSISQLYDEVKGNPDLETERGYNYEAGITQQLPLDTTVSVTAFCHDIEDYIQKDDYTEIYENRDRYRYRGFEVTAETTPFDGLTVRMGYTYLDTDDMSPGTAVDQIQYNPRDKLTLEASYAGPFGLTAYAALRHINRQYCYSKKEPYQKKRLNEYTLINAKISRKIYRDNLKVYLGADNLFDTDYETSYGLPQPGRFVYGGIKAEF